MKFINEMQMLFSGMLGIILRFAYMKRKERKISKINMWVYFIISFGILILLILFLRDKDSLWGFNLDDGTKMIVVAITSIFSEKFFTFLIDREQALFKGVVKKTTGIDVIKEDHGSNK